MHLMGDFPSPFLIGAVSQEAGMYWGTVMTMAWSFLCVTFWFLSFNFAVMLIQRFHRASFAYMKENFFKKNIEVPDHKEKLIQNENHKFALNSVNKPQNDSVNRTSTD